MSVNQVFMSFTGLAEVCQNEQSFRWMTSKTKNAKCLQIAPVADKVTINFLTKSTLSNFPMRSMPSAFFLRKTVLPVFFPAKSALSHLAILVTKVEDQLFQPKKG